MIKNYKKLICFCPQSIKEGLCSTLPRRTVLGLYTNYSKIPSQRQHKSSIILFFISYMTTTTDLPGILSIWLWGMYQNDSQDVHLQNSFWKKMNSLLSFILSRDSHCHIVYGEIVSLSRQSLYLRWSRITTLK